MISTEPETKPRPDFKVVDPERAAARLTFTYLFLAGGWIVLSDLWVYFFFSGLEGPLALQSGKGLLFVVVTGAILWRYLLLQFRRIRDAQQGLVTQLERQQVIEEELRRQKADMEHLADFPQKNPNTVLEVDDQGKVVYANPAAQSLAEACTGGDSNRLPDEALHREIARCRKEKRAIVDVETQVGERHFSWCLSPSRVNTVICYAREITARIQALRQLQESEQRYRLLVEQARDAIFLHDLDGKLLDVNPRACKSLGYTREELLVLSVPDVEVGFPQDHGDRLFQKLRRESTVTIEGTHRRKDGSTFPVEVQLGLVTFEGRDLMLAAARDISGRKKAEQQLRILQRAVEQSPASVVITDPQGNIEYVNPKFTQLTGYSQQEVLGQNPRILKSGRQPDAVYRDMWQTITSGHDWRGEFLNRKKNGELYWESLSISPIRDDQGHVAQYVAVKEDITERKRMDQTLRESEERHRLLFETAQDGILILDEERVVDCNQHALVLFGREREELVGKTPAELSPGFGSTSGAEFRSREKIEEALAGHPQVFEWQHVRGDGRIFECEVNLNRFDYRGSRFLQAIVRDITERKKVETALRDSEARLRLALEAAQMGTFDWDVERDRIEWIWPHPMLEAGIPGPNLAEFRRFIEGVHEEDRPGLTREIDRARAEGHAFLCEFRVNWNGGCRWLGVLGRFSYAGEERAVHLHGVVQDITGRKESEEKLRSALRERESLLREVHHRVKNNLQIVSSLLYLQSRKVQDETVLGILRESTDRIRSMALLHENLYRAGDLARIDLGKHIEDLCRHLFDTYGADPARIVLEMQLPSIHLDLDRAVPLGLLLNELVVNALKYAFPEGRKGTLRVVQGRTEEGGLRIVVEDDGVGLPPEIDTVAPNTTGLQLVRSLTGQLQGNLKISVNQGTSYTLIIPNVPSEAPAAT